MERGILEIDSEYKEYGGSDQFMLNGYTPIVSAMSSKLSILHRHIVQKITLSTSGVVVTTKSGKFEADRVIVTLPLGVLQKGLIEFEPLLPADKERSLERLGMTTLNKIVLQFPKAFWPREPHGFAQLANEDSAQLFFNVHHYHDAPILTYLISASNGREVEAMENADAVAYATDALKQMFGSSIPEPSIGLRTKWNNNKYSFGSFSYRKAGSSPSDRVALAAPIENRIFFAGEATHPTRYGTVHGAYLTGLRAAKELMRV